MKKMNKRYYQLEMVGENAELTIYGDITSFPWLDNDVSAYNLSKQLSELEGVSNINVYINSYGGEVAEGLAIYNALKRHKAHVTTYCDGMACSIASVIFMAGDTRIMGDASLLMIHNAWTFAEGNAKDMRKMADDLDKITAASVAAYMEHTTLSEVQLKHKMDAETWITPSEALEWGFATQIGEKNIQQRYAQSVRNRLLEIIMQAAEDEEEDEDEEAPSAPQNEPDTQDDESNDEEDSNDSEGNPEPQDDPDDDEDAEQEKEKTDPEPAQKWSGFFNALFRD